MALFRKKRPEVVVWAAAQARQILPIRYQNAWAAQIDDERSLYSYREAQVIEAMDRIEEILGGPGIASPDKMFKIAQAVVRDTADAMQFVSDMRLGKRPRLLALNVVYCHRIIYDDTLNEYLAGEGLVEPQIVGTTEDDLRLQAECLSYSKPLFDENVWMELVEHLSRGHSGAAIFRQVLN